MSPRRRAFVSTLVAALGGCTGLGSSSSSTPTARPDRDGDGVPDGADDYPDDGRRARRSSSSEGTTTIEVGEFEATALTNSPEASGGFLAYDVTVDGEGTVDCLVFRREDYDAFAEGARDVPVVSAFSRTDVSEAQVVEQLPEGEFIFALDYTEQATGPSRESVTVTYTVEMADPVSTATPE
ncbi:hypothetical protein [Halosimplex amylolyticum]|uniref:hypothetical protein n=1 Tax=Halosimplex amylolyticum TaxID=3396616 RepID=UPI003F5783E2